jgi:hypothetical protein
VAKPFLVYMPKLQFFNAAGTEPLSGGKVYFYSPGTTTPISTYPTLANAQAGTSANSNPIILDSSGKPTVDIYVTTSYKVVVKTSADVDVWTEDNITTIGQQITVSAKTSNYTVTVSDNDTYFTMDASAGARTFTLPAASSAGSGFRVRFKKIDSSSNAVTITPNGSDTIDGASSLSLSSQYSFATIVSNGTTWYVELNNVVGNLSVSGNLTVTGTANITGTTTVGTLNGTTITGTTTNGGNLRMASNTLSSTTGAITIDANSGSITLSDNVVLGGTITAAGSNTQVLYNDGGVIGADAGMTYNETTNVLTVDGLNLGETTLSIYEEGSFTPGISFNNASTGITYTTQTGQYTRIGNCVNFAIIVTISSKGSSTGAARVTGLPVASTFNPGLYYILNAVNLTSASTPYGTIVSGATTILLQTFASGGSPGTLTDTAFAADTSIRITGTYFV